MLVLQKGLILPVPMYGGSYFFIQPEAFTQHFLMTGQKQENGEINEQ